MNDEQQPSDPQQAPAAPAEVVNQVPAPEVANETPFMQQPAEPQPQPEPQETPAPDEPDTQEMPAVQESAEPESATDSEPESEPESDDEPDEEQQPTDEEASQDDDASEDLDEETGNLVRWTAHEYIHLEKNGLWYIIFVLVVIGLIALDLFILKSYTFSVLVIVMAVALIIYTRRPPRTIQYTLSEDHGLYIGDRLYRFDDYKAFGLLQDGEHHSIMMIPTKRFSPGVSVYFPEESGEEIVDILGARLPMQPLKLDFIDNVVRRLRL